MNIIHKKSLFFPLFGLLILIFSHCSLEKESNLNVHLWEGKDLNGKNIQFKDIKSPRLALNVYSPTCVPCFKEIPTLNYLAKQMKSSALGEFYMIVDPLNIVEDGDKLSRPELEKKAAEIMKMEVQKRGIELPVFIMSETFVVNPKGGLVTGTPETLLFKTGPLTLYYNFIGSISEKDSLEEIEKDNKVRFFKRILGGV